MTSLKELQAECAKVARDADDEYYYGDGERQSAAKALELIEKLALLTSQALQKLGEAA